MQSPGHRQAAPRFLSLAQSAKQNTEMTSLPQHAFQRTDESPDEEFYRLPRFVTHLDQNAIAAVTDLYRRYFPPGGAILDLMSSWVSHLPPEIVYSRVVGVGM